MSAEPGHKALEALNQALAKKPKTDGDAFTRATMCLSKFREEMIAGQHGGASSGADERLGRVNAVIAVVMGGHFPLGDVPWDELEKAQCWLKQLVNDVEAAV